MLEIPVKVEIVRDELCAGEDEHIGDESSLVGSCSEKVQ